LHPCKAYEDMRGDVARWSGKFQLLGSKSGPGSKNGGPKGIGEHRRHLARLRLRPKRLRLARSHCLIRRADARTALTEKLDSRT
jgi:hypothetical protein